MPFLLQCKFNITVSTQILLLYYPLWCPGLQRRQRFDYMFAVASQCAHNVEMASVTQKGVISTSCGCWNCKKNPVWSGSPTPDRYVRRAALVYWPPGLLQITKTTTHQRHCDASLRIHSSALLAPAGKNPFCLEHLKENKKYHKHCLDGNIIYYLLNVTYLSQPSWVLWNKIQCKWTCFKSSHVLSNQSFVVPFGRSLKID